LSAMLWFSRVPERRANSECAEECPQTNRTVGFDDSPLETEKLADRRMAGRTPYFGILSRPSAIHWPVKNRPHVGSVFNRPALYLTLGFERVIHRFSQILTDYEIMPASLICENLRKSVDNFSVGPPPA
jgi:hypothetical protein